MGKIKYLTKAGFTLIELLIARHPKPWRRKATLGFTLIELLVVIAILAILAAAVMIAINPNKRMQEARDATRLADTSQIGNSISEYYVTHGTYPPDPSLSTETEFASDEGPNWIPGLDNLPQDPNQAGIISTLASLINMKGNNQTTSDTAPKPQVAGTQSAEIAAQTTQDSGTTFIFESSLNPPDNATGMLYKVGNMRFGQAFDTSYPSTRPYKAYRGYLAFDTSTLPEDSTITSVNIQFKTQDMPNDYFTNHISFTLNARNYDWGDTVNNPSDWGGNPPSIPVVGSYFLDYRVTPLTFTIFIDPSAINKNGQTKFLLSTNREEANTAPIGNEYFSVWRPGSLNPPKLRITYTLPEPPPPPESPPPSPPPKGCKNKKKIYCYKVKEDRKSATLWAVLENEEDERIYSKPTAKCTETPPAETFLNYCIKDP